MSGTSEPGDAPEHGQPEEAPVAVAQPAVTRPEYAQYAEEPSRRTYDRLRKRWAGIDILEVADMPFEDRQRYAEISLRDAEFCRTLRFHPRTIGMPEYPQFFGRCLDTEIDLRMGALVLAPEQMNDEAIDNLVEVGMEITRQLGPGPERDFNDIDLLSKLHDIQALEALWKFRGAVHAHERVAAKVMLGDSIAEAMREIVSLSKRIDQATARMGKHVIGNPGGILAEFMLVTWERLNLYMASHEDIDVLGRVFIRSSLDREDKLAPSKDRSIDAVIMNLDRHYTRPQQYKASSGGTREYDRAIEVVRIPDWHAITENIDQIAWAFDIILSPTASGARKEQAREALGDYFNPARVTKVTR